MRKKKKTIFLTIILAAICAAVFVLVKSVPIQTPKVYGVTFSVFYAEEFGLDWKKTYTALFEDLGIRNVRISAYWNDTEKLLNQYDFTKLDWQVDEAKRHGATIILAMGQKLPRWPECHVPEWAFKLSPDERKKALFGYITAVVNRYKDRDNITIWQVENEPFLPFGDCKDKPSQWLDEEIALVKSLDASRPVMVTDSGELSLWIKAAKRSDIFGSTMYRSVYNKIFGYITYPLPPSFFRLKRTITELAAGKKPMIIVELQGEPWSREATHQLSVDDHYKTMNPEMFRDILEYSSKTGFDTFYLWGAEWWYWLKTTQNDTRMWDIAKEAIAKTN